VDALSRKRVLVADDNAINRQIALELIRTLKIDVTCVWDGESALEAARQGNFDIIFLDVQMPNMDGFEVTERLRSEQQTAQLVIVALTAHAMVGDRERCIYLSKPIRPEKLYQCLQHYLLPDHHLEDGTLAQLSASLNRQELGHTADFFDPVLYSKTGSELIDSTLGLATLDNDVALYQEVLKIFYEDYHDIGDAIRKQWLERDMSSLKRFSHTLCGLAATIGAEPLRSAAVELHQQLECEAGAEVAVALEHCLEQLQRACDQAKRLS